MEDGDGRTPSKLEVGGLRLRAEDDLAARGPEGGNAGIISNVRLDENESFYLTKSGEHLGLLSKATNSIVI